MVGTVCASGAVIAKAGSGISSDLTGVNWTTTSEYEGWIEEAEAYLSTLVKYDIVTNWATLNAVYKLSFTEYASRYAAVEAVKYDTSGYADRVEAEDIININLFRMNQVQELLDKSDIQDFQGV